MVRHRHDLPIQDILPITLDEARLALDEAERLTELHVLFVNVFAIVLLVCRCNEAAFFVTVGGHGCREILRIAFEDERTLVL